MADQSPIDLSKVSDADLMDMWKRAQAAPSASPTTADPRAQFNPRVIDPMAKYAGRNPRDMSDTELLAAAKAAGGEAPIEVEGPGGVIVEFPAGTSRDVMTAAMRKKFGGPVQPESTWSDVAKSAGAGLVRGGAMLAGIPGALNDLADWTVRKGGDAIGLPAPAENAPKPRFDFNPPNAAAIAGAIERNVTGELHQPQTTAGKYAQSVAEFAPTALAGPGGVIGNVVRYGVLPGVASEAAGQLAEGTKLEPYARVAGGFAGLGAGALTARPSTAVGAIREAAGNVDQATMGKALVLFDDAERIGVPLTWAEAIQQASGGATKLADVQRVAEASQRGGTVLKPFMAERPGQIEGAVRQTSDRIAPTPMDPYSVGPRIADAATANIEATREGINAAARPYYRAAEPMPIGIPDMWRVSQAPGFPEALRAVRNNPQLNRGLEHLPDDSVAVLDAVKKQLDQGAQNVASVVNPDRNLRVSSGMGQDARLVRDAAERASPDYARALEIERQGRESVLTPMQQGPIGRASQAATTEQTVEALLPRAPLAGSEGKVGEAFRVLSETDPVALGNLLKQRFEGAYNTAGRDITSGANEWAGARMRADLVGNRQAGENLRTALRETRGDEVAKAVDAFLDVMQATGRRQAPGSQTEFNRRLANELEKGGVIGETISSAGKVNPLAWARDRYQQYRYGSNTEALARALIDRGTGRDLSRAVRESPAQRTARLALGNALMRLSPPEQHTR